jgi:hypothetical protein
MSTSGFDGAHGPPAGGVSSSGLPPPDTLRFELLAEIASGPTARVELSRISAPEHRAGMLVAVKRLHPHIAEEPMFASMFADEIWMTALLTHPNVVRIVGWGSDAAGAYLAVELVEGVSLARLMKTMTEIGEQLSERLTVFVGRDVCAGLAAAHALAGPNGEPLHLVHRDLTPGNVLIGFDGSVKIADFGLAKAKQRLTRTITGLMKGQPRYMAPEQAREGPIDARADQFALGVMLYELFTGSHPWPNATELELLHAMATTPHQPLSKLRPRIDRELESIVHRLLARDPNERFDDIGDVLVRFDHWLEVHGYREDNAEVLARFVRRNAQRQMRWFERAVAEEFLGETVAARSRGSPRPDLRASTASRAVVGAPTRSATSTGRRRTRRAQEPSSQELPSRASTVAPASASSDALLALPDVSEGSSGEWTEDLPTRVKRRAGDAPARPARAPVGGGLPSFADEESDRTTTVRPHVPPTSTPSNAEANEPRPSSPVADPDTLDDALEAIPERASAPSSSREAQPPLPEVATLDPLLTAAAPTPPVPRDTEKSVPPVAEPTPIPRPRREDVPGADERARRPERSHDPATESARLLAEAHRRHDHAEQAAREAAHRAILAEVAAEAARLASEASSIVDPGRARELLVEAHRLEDVCRRASEPESIARARLAPAAVLAEPRGRTASGRSVEPARDASREPKTRTTAVGPFARRFEADDGDVESRATYDERGRTTVRPPGAQPSPLFGLPLPIALVVAFVAALLVVLALAVLLR